MSLKLAQIELKRQQEEFKHGPRLTIGEGDKERFLLQLAQHVEKEMEAFVEGRVNECSKKAIARVEGQAVQPSMTPQRRVPPSPGNTDTGMLSPPPGGWAFHRPGNHMASSSAQEPELNLQQPARPVSQLAREASYPRGRSPEIQLGDEAMDPHRYGHEATWERPMAESRGESR